MPLPSNTTMSGLRSAASRAPARTFETNGFPASPPPARLHPIVGTPVTAAISRWSEAAWRPERERATSSSMPGGPIDRLGLRRPAPPHRHDHDVVLAGEQPRQVRRHRGLPHPLAGADHRDRRHADLLVDGRVEAEVGADVAEPGGEGARGPGEPLVRAEHRLVREIDDRLGVAEPVEQRDAVPLPRPQLLAAARHDRPDPLVGKLDERTPHHVGCMLAVDQGHGSHRRTVTSFSIREVYFSYSSVSRSNWMIRS